MSPNLYYAVADHVKMTILKIGLDFVLFQEVEDGSAEDGVLIEVSNACLDWTKDNKQTEEVIK